MFKHQIKPIKPVIESSVRALSPAEKCEMLYYTGKEKLLKTKEMTDKDILKIERKYDENLTFQPTINEVSTLLAYNKTHLSDHGMDISTSARH